MKKMFSKFHVFISRDNQFNQFKSLNSLRLDKDFALLHFKPVIVKLIWIALMIMIAKFPFYPGLKIFFGCLMLECCAADTDATDGDPLLTGKIQRRNCYINSQYTPIANYRLVILIYVDMFVKI